MALAKMKFDLEEIPFPKTFTVSETDIQEEQMSEGGLTLIQTVRKGVLSADITTTAMSDVCKLYKKYSTKDSFVFTLYDPLTETQVEKTVKMYDFSYSLVKNSNELSVTNGIYNISCTLKEF